MDQASMSRTNAQEAAKSDKLFYRLLAGLLSAVIVVALVLGLGNAWEKVAPGWFLLEDAVVALFAMTIIMWLVLLIFLLRVRVFFDIEDRTTGIIDREMGRFQDAFGRQEANWNSSKEQMKQEFNDFRSQVRRDIAERDTRIGEAIAAAAEARRMALELEKSRQVIQKSQNEMAPAIMVLQEQVAALQKELKATNVRLGETVDALERREMETTAQVQKLEQEAAALRKREQLLLIKKTELEEAAQQAEARPVIKLTAHDEKHHVLAVEGIGPKFAARLNAAGIISIPQLVRADAGQVAKQVDATVELVKEWQAMGNLMGLRGIGPQFAEGLVRVGVTNAEQLSTSDPRELAQRIEAAVASGKLKIGGQKVTEGIVNRWVQAARSRDYDIEF